MCYTQEVYLTQEQIQAVEGRFSTPFDGENYVPYYAVSAFAHPKLPIVMQSKEGEYSIHCMQWGLIPHWCKSWEKAQEMRKYTPNAKAETLREKPSFKHVVSNKRCLVLSNGFYEWQTRGKEKVPYYIYLRDREQFSFAGLYDEWEHPDSGEKIFSFTIITTEANPLMAEIHNSKKRMPVILPEGLEKRWLKPELETDQALKLLQPYNEERMGAHTISKLITSRDQDNNVPEVKAPFSYGLFD